MHYVKGRASHSAYDRAVAKDLPRLRVHSLTSRARALRLRRRLHSSGIDSMLSTVARIAGIASTCLLVLSACGGHGGGGGNPSPPAPPAGPFSIGGSVVGLDSTASGLV